MNGYEKIAAETAKNFDCFMIATRNNIGRAYYTHYFHNFAELSDEITAARNNMHTGEKIFVYAIRGNHYEIEF